MDQDLAGRHVVITGANTGIGRATAEALAARGAAVTIAARSAAKTEPVVEAIRARTGNAAVDYQPLDLASQASIRQAAAALLARDRPIHVLVANAGVGGQRGATVEGFELQFGVNHLGHYLLTELLLERLRASAPARVVVVASTAHYGARAIRWDALRQPTRSLTGFPEYQVSKLCNVLHAAELGRRLEGTGVTTYAVHPGVIASDIWRRLPWIVRRPAMASMNTVEEGARSSVRAAVAPEVAGETGLFYGEDGQPRKPSRLARDAALADELRRRSEAWIAEAR